MAKSGPSYRVIVDGEEQVIKTLEEYRERFAAVSPLLGAVGMHMVRSVQKNFRQGGRPPWPQSMRGEQEGGKPLSMTGRLRNSIAFLTQGDAVYVGTNVAYGRLQQYGGVIVPKQAKALAIPLNRAARRLAVGVQSIREIKGLFFVKAKGSGNNIGILARKARMSYDSDSGEIKKSATSKFAEYKTKSGKKKVGLIEPMFALRKSSKVRARPFLVIQPDDRVYIEKITARYIRTGKI